MKKILVETGRTPLFCGGKGAPFLFGMGASKNTVWGMAAYDLRGMEDGNFYRLKCRIAMENEGIPLSQTAFPKG